MVSKGLSSVWHVAGVLDEELAQFGVVDDPETTQLGTHPGDNKTGESVTNTAEDQHQERWSPDRPGDRYRWGSQYDSRRLVHAGNAVGGVGGDRLAIAGR